jgi:anti-sigma B factor antagonist
VTDVLNLTLQHASGPLAVATVTGAIDLHTAPTLRCEALQLISRGHRNLILDMSRTGFCDSSGLNALIGIWHGAQGAEGSLALAAVPYPLTRMLTLTGLDDLLPVHPTTADALAAYAEHPDPT